jgi:hypothetical protein
LLYPLYVMDEKTSNKICDIFKAKPKDSLENSRDINNKEKIDDVVKDKARTPIWNRLGRPISERISGKTREDIESTDKD